MSWSYTQPGLTGGAVQIRVVPIAGIHFREVKVTNRGMAQLLRSCAIIADQRSRGLDPWSPECWAERQRLKKGKGPESTVPAPTGLLDVRRAVQTHRRAEVGLRAAILGAYAAGESPSAIAKAVGVTRQRIHQIVGKREREAVAV